MQLTEMQRLKLGMIIGILSRSVDSFRDMSQSEIESRISGSEVDFYYKQFKRLGMI